MKKKFYLFGLALLVAGSAMATTLLDGHRNDIPIDNFNGDPNIDVFQHHRSAKDLVIAGSGSNYKAYCSVVTTAAGEELWVSDGLNATDHTFMVKDINPGTTGSDVKYLARFNDKVVFSANDGTNGAELWISDGTAAGTYMIKDINASGDSNPMWMTQVNETQFVFGAIDGTTTYPQLWVSDGTAAGTSKVLDCQFLGAGTDYSISGHTAPILRVGRKVFFKGDDAAGTHGESLWVTDGTAAGTQLVKAIGHIDYMVNYYNQKLFFAAGGDAASLYPYATDGTEAGTKQVGTRRLWSNVGGPCKGLVFYRGDGGLVATNLNAFSTAYAMPAGYYPISGVEYKGKYFFGVENADYSNLLGYLNYLDVDNGTVTAMPAQMSGGAATNNVVTDLQVVSGTLWMISNKSSNNAGFTSLFKLESLTDVPGPADSYIALSDNLRDLNGSILWTNKRTDIGTDQKTMLHEYLDWRKTGFDAATETDDLSLKFDALAIDLPTGIKDAVATSSANFTVYPNPTSDSFSFNANGTAKDVKVFDLAGRLVKDVAQPAGRISVSGLSAGMYKVMVTTSTGRYVSSLIVK